MNRSEQAFSSGWNYWSLDLEKYPSGVYFLGIQTTQGVETIKLIRL